jgi:hypothetical protein
VYGLQEEEGFIHDFMTWLAYLDWLFRWVPKALHVF